MLTLLGLLLAPVAPAAGVDGDAEQSRRLRRQLHSAPRERLLQPADFVYLGAFRLPERAEGASDAEGWEYSGQALTYRPTGDPLGPADGFPGSLFASGFDVVNLVAEIDVPVPVVSPGKDVTGLPVARMLQPFTDVRGSMWGTLLEMPRLGLEWLDTAMTGEKVHMAWGQHLQDAGAEGVASHGWFDPNLGDPRPAGAWWIGQQSLYSVNGYIFEIPAAWADTHVGGRRLATGRFRDGGWSGQGPSLYAYAPWLSGSPPADGTRLDEVPLLHYTPSDDYGGESSTLAGYQHPDEWEGGAWVTTVSGATAVIFVGTKGVGTYYWYGWADPTGTGAPCVEMDGGGVCFAADGTPCPPELVQECPGHTTHRGWWSSRFQAQVLLYDPADLAAVAAGEMHEGSPQPYATLSLDPWLFLSEGSGEDMILGSGQQRRFRVGEAAYDRARGHLFVPELFADGARPVIHVWRLH